MNKDVREFLGSLRKWEHNIISDDLNTATMCNYNVDTMEGVKEYYSDKETQVCFVKYSNEPVKARNLLEKLLKRLDVEQLVLF